MPVMDANMNSQDLHPLSQEIVRMSGALDVMRATSVQEREHTTAALARFQDSLDKVVGKLDGLQVIASRMETHDDSLRRAWAHINDQDKRLDEVERKSSRAIGVAIGLSLMAGALIGIVSYLYTQDREEAKRQTDIQDRTMESNRERLQKVEIYLAGPKNQPYTR